MLEILTLFFLLPLIITIVIFSLIGVLIIPILFLVVSSMAIILFSGFFHWVFLGLFVASFMYLALFVGNIFFKKVENRKVFRFAVIAIVALSILLFIHYKYTHTVIRIIDQDTGETTQSIQNIIDF